MNLACKMLDRIHAVKMFQHLEESNDRPNEIGFLSLLSACGHAGLVEEGNYVFARMLSYSVKPNLKHSNCMVDLLGRSGNLQQAEALVLSMLISPYGGVWGNFFSRCRSKKYSAVIANGINEHFVEIVSVTTMRIVTKRYNRQVRNRPDIYAVNFM